MSLLVMYFPGETPYLASILDAKKDPWGSGLLLRLGSALTSRLGVVIKFWGP